MCRAEFLHHLRIREWQDVHAQLRRVLRQLGVQAPSGAEAARVRTGDELAAVRDQVHTALLAGLLTQVGTKDERAEDKRGRDGAREAGAAAAPPSTWAPAAPGSPSRRGRCWPSGRRAGWSPAELLETSRLWARVVARVGAGAGGAPGGAPRVRSHSEPRWSKQRGAAVATERVTLYGLPLVAGRTVPLARLDPETARDLFIRHALVGGEWDASRRVARPWPSWTRTPGSPSRSRSCRPAPAGATCGSTTSAGRLLRRAPARRRHQRPRVRVVVAPRAPHPSRPADPHRRRPHDGRGGGRRGTDVVELGGLRPVAELTGSTPGPATTA